MLVVDGRRLAGCPRPARGTARGSGRVDHGPPALGGRPTTSEVIITATTATVPALAVLDRQVDTLLDLGYPALAGLTPTELTDRLAPLRGVAATLGDLPGGGRARPRVAGAGRHP